jgi:hypothetical protein
MAQGTMARLQCCRPVLILVHNYCSPCRWSGGGICNNFHLCVNIPQDVYIFESASICQRFFLTQKSVRDSRICEICVEKSQLRISRKKTPLFLDVAKRPAFPQPPEIIIFARYLPELNLVNMATFLFFFGRHFFVTHMPT